MAVAGPGDPGQWGRARGRPRRAALGGDPGTRGPGLRGAWGSRRRRAPIAQTEAEAGRPRLPKWPRTQGPPVPARAPPRLASHRRPSPGPRSFRAAARKGPPRAPCARPPAAPLSLLPGAGPPRAPHRPLLRLPDGSLLRPTEQAAQPGPRGARDRGKGWRPPLGAHPEPSGRPCAHPRRTPRALGAPLCSPSAHTPSPRGPPVLTLGAHPEPAGPPCAHPRRTPRARGAPLCSPSAHTPSPLRPSVHSPSPRGGPSAPPPRGAGPRARGPRRPPPRPASEAGGAARPCWRPAPPRAPLRRRAVKLGTLGNPHPTNTGPPAVAREGPPEPGSLAQPSGPVGPSDPGARPVTTPPSGSGTKRSPGPGRPSPLSPRRVPGPPSAPQGGGGFTSSLCLRKSPGESWGGLGSPGRPTVVCPARSGRRAPAPSGLPAPPAPRPRPPTPAWTGGERWLSAPGAPRLREDRVPERGDPRPGAPGGEGAGGPRSPGPSRSEPGAAPTCRRARRARRCPPGCRGRL
ncbi:basic proline-rich protein-like [Perognathus longimembris pacificus]|uniref:basic proline-rich protein-like n=1 Tax=Perognathus longimembris pacificus TaxID=214514 RepID=UPI002018EBD5|nr:basic proline-rich protein-like [Perognathus longimembris pacificus]